MVEFNPTHEVREEVDVVWQIPPKPKAVLYLAHSANGSPWSYWPPHPNVPRCEGTPEHQVLVKQALERGFAVIAGKSVTNEWKTWPASTIDIQKAVKILEAWRGEHGLEGLPLSAWGTSCGGDFVSTLATVVKMHSLIIMISHGHEEAIKSAVVGQYPATLWVPMIKDERTFYLVKENAHNFKEKGIPTAIVEALPLEVHPHFFAEHIDELDKEQSASLHSLFVEHGVVAEDNSLQRALMKHDVEPYLRRAKILPASNEAESKRDEEKLEAAKELHLERGTKQTGGPGRGGPPHEGPPHGGRVGGRGPPPGGRGRGPPKLGEGPPGGPPGGRGRGLPNRGSGPPASHPLAGKVSNQLIVAEGMHTLTSRHNATVFDWLEGKGWPET